MRLLLALFIISVSQFLFAAQSGLRFESCEDPNYIEYVNNRLDFYKKTRKEAYEKAQQNLQVTPFANMSSSEKRLFLHTNTILSARFDSKEQALFYIEAFEKSTSLLRRLFGMRGHMDIVHRTNIARAWLASKEGDKEETIKYLLKSTQVTASPVLVSFGPDRELIRELYQQGEREAVLEYLERVSVFWNNESATEYLQLWRKMIKHNCPIQFQFYDTTSTESFNLD